MTVVISLRKWAYLPYCSFCLVVLLYFAGACKEKKSASSLHLPKRNQIESPFSNASSSNQVENDGSNIAQPALSSLKKPATDALDLKKEEQASIISRAHAAVEEEKEYREKFSKELSPITDISTRDEIIASCRKERNQRIEAFNILLAKVEDQNEKQRLIADFQDTKGMWDEWNLVNNKYGTSLNSAEQKKIGQELGDIREKYSGYAIESKRQQIRSRVERLINFAARNHLLLSNKQEQDRLCKICHKAESISLLPCRDYVHVDCLVEAMIFVWRQGHNFVFTCPGACGNCLPFHYFLFDEEYATQYLTMDKWKEIFFEFNSK